jgi:hypothetical protein
LKKIFDLKCAFLEIMCLNKNFAIDMPNYLFRSFDDPGPHGAGRYSEHMLPEIVKKDWRKGAQVIFFFV